MVNEILKTVLYNNSKSDDNDGNNELEYSNKNMVNNFLYLFLLYNVLSVIILLFIYYS